MANAPWTCLLALLACLVPAGDASEEWEQTRANLLRDVEEVAAPGIPGSICAFGERAVVVVADANGVPAIAAGEGGKGRLVLMGHGGYLGAASFSAFDTERLMRNTLRWLADGRRRPQAFCPDAKVAEALDGLGLRTETSWDELDRCDVIVLDPGGLTPERERRVRRFLLDGGGGIFAVTGWGWLQLNSGKTLQHDHPANRIAREFGLAFGGETTKETERDSLLANAHCEPTLNVRHGLSALAAGTLDGEARTRALARLRASFACLPDHESTFVDDLRSRMEAEPREPALDLLADAYGKREWRPRGLRYRPWSVLGPLGLPKGGRDVTATLKPEKDLARMRLDGEGPNPKASYRTRLGKTGWEEMRFLKDGEVLDVGPISMPTCFPDPKRPSDLVGVAAYLHRELVSDAARELRVDVAHGAGGLRAWLNGELVEERESGSHRGKIVLSLRPGRNHLLIKLARVDGAWSFRLQPADGGVSQQDINAAIDRGVDYFIERQLVDGSWSEYKKWGPGYTAYVVYALLKSKVPREHPAIQRGMAYVYARETPYNYSRACKVLAMCAYEEGRPSLELEDEVAELIDIQPSVGIYDYPVYPGGGRPPQDLSITVYVALALHAAQKQGVEVWPSVWERMIDGVATCAATRRNAAERARGAPLGFTYRANDGKATGSMTTAAMTILLLAKDALGSELPRREVDDLDELVEGGLTWIDRHMDWHVNPGHTTWHFYFVYGLERVGSLLDRDVLGGLEWYPSGAEYLLGRQKDDGSIPAEQGAHDGRDTVLALLFLNKATSPTTGRVREEPKNLYTAEAPADAIHVRAQGVNPVDVWITGFSEDLERTSSWPGRSPGVRIERVVWRLQRDDTGEAALAAEVEARDDGFGERFAARVTLPGPGSYQLFGEATLLVPPAQKGLAPERRSVETGRVLVALEGVQEVDPTYALDHDRNAALDVPLEVEASSHFGDQTADKAFDGYHGTRWHSDVKEAEPSIVARFERSVTVTKIRFSHAWPQLDHKDAPRPSRVRVEINGEEQRELDIHPDAMVKTALELGSPTRIVELKVTILASIDRKVGTDAVGFSEIELIRED